MDEEKILEYGVFNVPATKELMIRVSYILHFLEELIDKYSWKKVTVGLEDTQESKMNVNTFQLLTRVLGAIEYFLFNKNIPYKVCHVSSWRNHSGIKGKSRIEKKANAIKKVKEKFDILAKEDAAEAILITDYLRHDCGGWK
jgi:Holliday junction resolvasome RuvABC endonuclease subunit